MLSDAEVLTLTEARVRDGVGYLTSSMQAHREKAAKYYRGDAFGNEVAGRSEVVSRDVAQYVDTVMPSLMRIFASGDEVVAFEPMEPGDEAAAEQASDYVNWIWNNQNPGFKIFHDWFKDALLNKLGVVKIWWDEAIERTREEYQGLTVEEFAILQGDPDVEISDLEAIAAIGPDGMPTQAFNVVVSRKNVMGQCVVEPLPGEEFIFGRRAKSDTDADVLAHRGRKTRSDLIEIGYDRDLVDTLFMGDDGTLTSERITRFADVDDVPIRMSNPGDTSAEVEVIEAYLRLDRDEDGIAEYLKVVYSGKTVLEVEEVDDHPFAILSPILMPHRLVGMSLADSLFDIQLIKSTLLRQYLDNAYLQNMPQLGVVDGQVNVDDVLTRRPGGIIRMKNPNALIPLPTQPLGGDAFAMIEYWDSVAEQRTGATRYNQGLDADTLNKTASGINLIQNAAAQRLELIARIYAETGVKRAFKRILSLVCKHQQKPRMIRLRNQWVPMDPRGWKDGMDITVSVGLGNGNKDQIVAHMMTLLQMDQQIIQMQGGAQGPLVTMENVYAKLKKLLAAVGLKGVEQYYTDPKNAPQQAPQPPPEVMKAQMEAQARMQETQAKLAADQQKAQMQAELDIQLEQVKLQSAERLEMIKIQAQQEIERIRIEAENMRHQMTLATQRETTREAAEHGMYSGEADRALKRELADSARATKDD